MIQLLKLKLIKWIKVWLLFNCLIDLELFKTTIEWLYWINSAVKQSLNDWINSNAIQIILLLNY